MEKYGISHLLIIIIIVISISFSGCFHGEQRDSYNNGAKDNYIGMAIENVTLNNGEIETLRQLSFNLIFNKENDTQTYSEWEIYNLYKPPIVIYSEYNLKYFFKVSCFKISEIMNNSKFKFVGNNNSISGYVSFEGNKLSFDLNASIVDFYQIQYTNRYDTDNSALIITKGNDGGITILFEPTSPPP